MHSFGAKAALLAAVAIGTPGAAAGAGLDQFIGFGDSTMDSGYFRYGPTGGSPSLPPPYQFSDLLDRAIQVTVAAGGSGAFMGPGAVDTFQLAAKFGVTATPVTIPGGGGTNYANGSAQTVPTTADNGYASGLYNNVPIVTQIYNYLGTTHGVANPNALYMISFGGNDLTWLDNQGGGVSPPAYLGSLATALTTGIAQLQAAGARTIVVLSVYSYARAVGPNGTLAPADAVNVNEAALYSADVWSGLRAAGVNFIPADIEGLLKHVSQNPAPFGFTPATVLASNAACGLTSALVCAPGQLVAPDAEQTHLWSDAHHLTTAGQAIETDYIYSLLTAPSQVSLLAEAAVQAGLARTTTIQAQIDLSMRHRGPTGINAWASAGANSLSLTNARDYPNASGIPFNGTVGADLLTPSGIILGAAVTAGDLTQDFSTGGHFGQAGEAVSLYAAYATGPVWGSAVASFGVLQNHIARQVPLNNYIDGNSADPGGRVLALALRGGYDFHLGPVSAGPVAGIVLQQVNIDGFTESGATGMTALAFGSQSRGSAISQLGFRAAVDLGKWQPFVDMEWNHEMANKNRTITTSLTSIAAPSWTAAAAPAASDWATAWLGVAYQVGAQTTVRAGLTSEFANPHAASYGGELSVNVAF